MERRIKVLGCKKSIVAIKAGPQDSLSCVEGTNNAVIAKHGCCFHCYTTACDDHIRVIPRRTQSRRHGVH